MFLPPFCWIPRFCACSCQERQPPPVLSVTAPPCGWWATSFVSHLSTAACFNSGGPHDLSQRHFKFRSVASVESGGGCCVLVSAGSSACYGRVAWGSHGSILGFTRLGLVVQKAKPLPCTVIPRASPVAYNGHTPIPGASPAPLCFPCQPIARP